MYTGAMESWNGKKAREDAIKHGLLESESGELDNITADKIINFKGAKKSKESKRIWHKNHGNNKTGISGEPVHSRPSDLRKLTDEEVIICRRESYTIAAQHLAFRYGVSRATMSNAIRGYTYKHLNDIAKPRY